MSLAFFDTNVLIYCDDKSSPQKQQRAIQLIGECMRDGSAAMSVQVLQEYFYAATRKLKMEPDKVQRKIEILIDSCKIVRVTELDVVAAIELHRLHKLSFWDALIVHSAHEIRAGTLYSEDLQADRSFGNLKVVNPF